LRCRVVSEHVEPDSGIPPGDPSLIRMLYAAVDGIPAVPCRSYIQPPVTRVAQGSTESPWIGGLVSVDQEHGEAVAVFVERFLPAPYRVIELDVNAALGREGIVEQGHPRSTGVLIGEHEIAECSIRPILILRDVDKSRGIRL